MSDQPIDLDRIPAPDPDLVLEYLLRRAQLPETDSAHVGPDVEAIAATGLWLCQILQDYLGAVVDEGTSDPPRGALHVRRVGDMP